MEAVEHIALVQTPAGGDQKIAWTVSCDPVNAYIGGEGGDTVG